MSAHSKGGILKCDQLLTEKEIKQVYKASNPKKGVKINVLKVKEDENTYQNSIIADINQKKDTKPMESWSILSDHLKYVQHDES